MKRTMLVDIRNGKDNESGDELLFLTLYVLPTRMKNGGLWHQKKNEAIINACVNATRKPELYARLQTILPGALVDISFAINEFNQKTYVDAIVPVYEENPYTEAALYL